MRKMAKGGGGVYHLNIIWAIPFLIGQLISYIITSIFFYYKKNLKSQVPVDRYSI